MASRRRVVLGGTFDHLHVGHHALLATAFSTGPRVAIGLTTDAYLRAHPKAGPIAALPYSRRRSVLTRWLRAHVPRRSFAVVPLEDQFGRSIGSDVATLVASVETRAGALAVNRERRRLGLPPLQIVLVPLVLGDDLRPVSSTRIRSGAIDSRGRRISPIRIGIRGSSSPAVSALHDALGRLFPRAIFDAEVVRSPQGPRGTPQARAWSRDALRGNELGFGIASVAGRPAEVMDTVVSERSDAVELFPRRLSGPAVPSARSLLELLRPVGPSRDRRDRGKKA